MSRLRTHAAGTKVPVLGGEQFSGTTRQGVAVVETLSELDLSNVDGLRESFLAAIDAAGLRVVLDLDGTMFLDSTVLGLLVQLAKRLAADGGWLRLAGS